MVNPARLLLLSLLIVTTTRAQQSTPTSPLPLEPNKPYTHAQTAITFQPAIPPFTRVSGQRFDAAGHDIAITYRAPAISIAAYIVPAQGRTFDAYLKESKAAVTQANAHAKLLADAPIEVKQDPRTQQFHLASYQLTFEDAQKQPLTVRSDLYLADLGNFFLKYRATYPPTDAAAANVTSLIASIAVPERKQP